MRVDPTERQQIIIDLVLKYLVLIRRRARIGGTRLLRDNKVSHAKDLLLGQKSASQNTTRLDASHRVAMRTRHKLIEHVAVHLNFSERHIIHGRTWALIGHQRESTRITRRGRFRYRRFSLRGGFQSHGGGIRWGRGLSGDTRRRRRGG